MMLEPPLPTDEIVRRGKEWYEKLRPFVETPQNIGKQIVIDVENGDYEIDENGLTASHRILDKKPIAALFGHRIGYNAAYSLGGFLRPTARL